MDDKNLGLLVSAELIYQYGDARLAAPILKLTFENGVVHLDSAAFAGAVREA
jgi:hypothetical protein